MVLSVGYSLSYSKNNGEWTAYSLNTVITLEKIGDRVAFQNSTNTLSTGNNNYLYFVLTGTIKAYRKSSIAFKLEN